MEIINVNNTNSYMVKGINKSFKFIYLQGNVWLNTKEISNLFWIYEFQTAEYIKDILFNSEIDMSDSIKRRYNNDIKSYDNYYSIDLIISIWYRLKRYSETKLLISSNKYIKEYNINRESRLSYLNKKINKVVIAIKNIDRQMSLAI